MDHFEPLGKSNLSKPAPANASPPHKPNSPAAKPSQSTSQSMRKATQDLAKTRPDFENTAGFRLAERILDRSKPLDPELNAKTPRTLELKEELDHQHQNIMPLVGALVAVVFIFGGLCLFTYVAYHELPLYAVALMGAGVAILAYFIVTQAQSKCDCNQQKALIAAGTAVIGQVTEKRTGKTKAGASTYDLEYAFQPTDSEESYWAWMHVHKNQFDSLDEGDDVTVVYMQHKKDNYLSRIYRFCLYKALSGN